VERKWFVFFLLLSHSLFLDVRRLRIAYRTIGSLIGSVPSLQVYSREYSVPMLLSVEQTCALIKAGLFVFIFCIQI
jgi:hypothetical protein